MKNGLFKDFIREIKGNMGRFMSIFFIVLLGSAFFSGIRSAGADMRYTADVYYDKTDMMDIRVLSSLGLTDDDIKDISKVEGVEYVVGGHTKEAMISSGEDQHAVKLIAKTDDINKMTLKEGREPKDKDECVVDTHLMFLLNYKIGDTIKLESGTKDPLTDDLAVTEYKIVGTGYLPYYIDIERGSGSIGDGSIDGFIVTLPEAFTTDIYTEAYVKVKGAKELNTYSDEYDELVEETADRIEAISDAAGERRYKEVYTEAEEKISDGEKEIADAQKELDDAKTELDDGKKELDDAKIELDDGKKELDDAKAEIDDGKKELDDAKAELDDGKVQLEKAERELADAKSKLDSSKKDIENGEAELNDNKARLDSAKQQLDDSKAQIDSGRAEVDSNEAALNEKEAELDAGWQAYNEGVAELEEQKAQLDTVRAQLEGLKQQLEMVEKALLLNPTDPELNQKKAILEAHIQAISASIEEGDAQIAQYSAALEENKAKLTEGTEQIAQGRAAIEAARAELDEGERQYNEGLAEYNSGLAQYEEGLKTFNEGKQKYEDGLAEYDSGKAKYDASVKDYKDGLSKYNDGYKEWEDGLAEYNDGYKEWEDGLAEYNDGYKEWEDGKKEYDDSYDEAVQKIEDAKEELEDARHDLNKLEKAKWYILDRDKISSCVSYGMDAERMDNLGNVFPVIFFLVAALVSLTAMTRMVEEQRQQIGTLKALGYSGIDIAGKYIWYALLATVGGAVIGAILGEIVLPTVILSSYCVLYIGLPAYYVPMNLMQGGLAVAMSVLCTGLATIAACHREVKDKPAELMRPEPPKSGRRIFLEYIGFIWKKLNFTQKSTLRNLFRYKKRFIMTIIGISGCMSLMLVGFGIRDSITVVAQNQYIEIFKQNATVSIDTSADENRIQTLEDRVSEYQGINESLDVCELSVTLNANDTDRSAYLFVPEEADKTTDFVRFRNRVTGEEYSFPKEGVTLSEKTASMLGVSVGDTITIQKSEDSDGMPVKVAGIIENYVQHYAFISADTYRSLFDEEPEYNFIYVKYDDNSAAYEKQLGTEMMKLKACSGISFTNDLEKMITDTLQTLDLVIWVLIISAALLAFVVLYNLNSINMTERKRELATLKVLGFYDTEVAMYVYRENIILTLIGIVVGSVIGSVLHLFTILTVEVDLMMFGRVISPMSYIICAAITFAFSLIVNLVMYYNFKKIDMVESLKSVE